MDTLENILSQEVVHKLGWTLLHSLWQGGVAALLLVVLLRVLRKSSANLRYVVACLGLALITLLPVLTFYVVPAPVPMPDVESVPSFSVPVTGQLQEVYDADVPLQRAAEYMQMSPAVSWRQRAMNFYTSALPYIVFGWLVGVIALCLWHLGGWAHLQRLKRQKVNLVDESLKGKLRNLAERLKVTRPVMLMESALVQIPTVVGWFQPAILLPASALTGLSREQLEALLAHELAHIRRYDYLVNMFQTVVEILGFYHPAVWWISYTIRVERENCCDDLAISVCGDKVGYARALTSMEEARLSQGELAVAASGGNLSRRIRRLIGTGSEKNIRFGYVPVVISILLVVALMIPTTLALTAKRDNKDSSSVSTAESDSIKAVDSYTEATDQINDSEGYPVADLDETAAKAQILFDCKIYEVPADLKFLESEQKKYTYGQIILLGKEYAGQLESLSRENKNVKLLASPMISTLDGKQAVIKSDSALPYTAGYGTAEDAGDEQKPITKMALAGLELKIKGRAREDGQQIDLYIYFRQFKPSFGTHKDDEGREIQIPVTESSDCTTSISVRSGESIIIGGLRSNEGPSRNLILTITPSIVLPEKGPEQAKIKMEVRTVDSDPGRKVELRAAEAEKIDASERLAELQSLLIQDQDLKMALEDQALELQQKLYDVQMKLTELETRKAELSELNKLSSALASQKEAESERKRAKKGEEPGYHTLREGDSVAVPSVVLDDERLEAEKAVIQAQINALEAQLIELRKNYEAEIFNRQSEWWAEMRAFTADVVAAQKSILDANTVLERDFAVLKKIEVEIKNFKLENGDNIAKDNALYNKLKTMTANRDAIKEQIKRDRLKLAKNQKELEEAVARREQYFKYRPRAGTDPNEAQRVINLAKQALELQLYELKGLSSEQTSPKEPKSGGEPRYHTVREGETLSSISEKYYGSENKWQKILDYNREIITADGIRVGQQLIIPHLQASAKEPESEHEQLAVMAAKFAERGDFAKAIELIEKSIELAKAEKYYGIGIAIEKVDGLIRIGGVLPNTPASGSSFQQGDIIEAVDGVSTEGMSLDDVVAGIVGPKGTEVTLSVKSHSQDVTEKKTFTRQLPLEGSQVLRAYEWRLAAYKAGKTWPQYRRMMEKPEAQTAGAPRIFELRYASAEELAEVLSRILERRWKGVKDRSTQAVRIIPEPNRNRLIVIASPDDIQLIEALIAELDVSPPKDGTNLIITPRIEPKSDSSAENTITQVINLKYADCESVEQILLQIISDTQLRRIATDKRTNKLIVAGTESTIQQIKDLVAEIDVPAPDKDLEVGEPEKQEGKDF